jgi:hypothetical protein
MELFSVNRLAGLLEKDRQTVKRALRGVKPDGEERGQDRWKMTTAVRALEDHQGGRTSGGVNYRLLALADQIEETWSTIDDHFAQLRAVKEFVPRGDLLQKLKTGLLLQKLSDLLRQANAMDDKIGTILQIATDEMMRELHARYFDIVGFEVAEDAKGRFIRIKASEIADAATRKKWGHIDPDR